MPKYLFVVTTTISLHTEVETDSLEEAIEEAKSRAIQSLCHQCAKGEDDVEWTTSGELDGDPMSGELVDLYIDDEDLTGAKFAKIQKQWADM